MIIAFLLIIAGCLAIGDSLASIAIACALIVIGGVIAVTST